MRNIEHKLADFLTSNNLNNIANELISKDITTRLQVLNMTEKDISELKLDTTSKNALIEAIKNAKAIRKQKMAEVSNSWDAKWVILILLVLTVLVSYASIPQV